MIATGTIANKGFPLGSRRQTAQGIALAALVAGAMLPAAFGLMQSSGAGITGTAGTTQPDLGKLPLQFEANRGQAVPECTP